MTTRKGRDYQLVISDPGADYRHPRTLVSLNLQQLAARVDLYGEVSMVFGRTGTINGTHIQVIKSR